MNDLCEGKIVGISATEWKIGKRELQGTDNLRKAGFRQRHFAGYPSMRRNVTLCHRSEGSCEVGAFAAAFQLTSHRQVLCLLVSCLVAGECFRRGNPLLHPQSLLGLSDNSKEEKGRTEKKTRMMCAGKR